MITSLPLAPSGRPRPFPRLPPVAPGLRVGLFGGSFNPAHDGHRRASLLAMTRLRLDRVWWVVTPGNPLKDAAGLPSLPERMAAAQLVARHPRIHLTGFEAEIGTRFTADTLAWLVRRRPGVHFVWIMGADNLLGFHHWRDWREIARLMPMAVVDRPGATVRAAASPAARALARARQPEREAPLLADRRPSAWVVLHGPRSHLSSTALRARKRTGAEPRPR